MSILNPALRTGLSLLLLIGLIGPAAAARVDGLYEAQVPAAGEDTDSRNQAIVKALDRVLVKLTGRDPVPGGDALSAQAAGLAQQFRFQRAISPEGQASTRLWVRFDKVGLDRAMRQHGLPLWSDSRPGVLVWLAAEQDGRRELVTADAPLGRATRAAAEARGLPLQWPLLDLEDQSKLTAADLWSDYGQAVQQASDRYSQPLVLTGRVRQVAADHWEGRWTLYQDGGERDITSTGATADEAAAAAIDRVTDRLASRYAPAGTQDGPQRVYLQVEGIHSVSDYSRVFELLGNREIVDRVWLRRAQRDNLYLDVLVRGGRDALAQSLDLAGALQRQPDPVPSSTALPTVQLPPVAAPAAPAPAVAAPSEGAPVVEGVAPAEGEAVAAVDVATPAAAPPPPPPPPPPPVMDLLYRLVR